MYNSNDTYTSQYSENQHFMNATTAIVLDKRIKRKDDTYAVKLRITFNRTQQYYPLNIHLSSDDWEKVQTPNSRGEAKKYKMVFNNFEQKAVEVIRETDPFTFAAFNKKFLNEGKNEKGDVFGYFESYIQELKDQDRIGTSDSYNNAYNSFKTFINDKRRTVLPFEYISPDFLNKYESWMVANGKSLTTVGIYARSIRTILNMAIENGKLSKEDYPFGKRKYQIPASRNIKKAAQKSDIKKIVDYVPKTQFEAWGRDMWLFSYLCNGANIKDIVLLKEKNMDSKSIQFIRSKTERSTKQDLKAIMVMRIPKINEIIEKWGLKNKTSNTYVFGLVEETDTIEKKRAKIKDITKRINKYMRRVVAALELEIDLTTYSARHSFATILKRSGASTEFIGESLGHKNNKTTENYLDSFEDEMKMEFQNKLMEF